MNFSTLQYHISTYSKATMTHITHFSDNGFLPVIQFLFLIQVWLGPLQLLMNLKDLGGEKNG